MSCQYKRRVFALLLVCITLVLLQFPTLGWAWYPRLEDAGLLQLPRRSVVVGTNKPYVIGWDETLMEIARRAGLGFNALVSANPGVDEWQPRFGTELTLPYATIVPADLPLGITINLAEYRLYLVEKDGAQQRVRIYPIGLGREGWQTPEGEFRIISSIENPSWTRPETIRAEEPDTPNVIAAGPDNPLGTHWLGLSLPGYGIHGTNRPYGVGRRVSHGCIRLYPGDIDDLAGRVGRGTPVKIIYRPIKLAIKDNRLLLEAHPDYLKRGDWSVAEMLKRASALGWQGELDMTLIRQAIELAQGIPVPVAELK